MTIVLFVILALFGVPFLLGIFAAARQGSNQKRRSWAIVAISQLSEEQRAVLVGIFKAYQNKDVEKANRIVELAGGEIVNSLVRFCSLESRPVQFSSGRIGAHLWSDFSEKLKELGYSDDAARIITGIVSNDYNMVLEKLASG